MKLLVCGGRDLSDRTGVFAALDALHAYEPVTLLIEGGARGADSLAGDWAISRGIPRRTFMAEWERHGPAAGPIRNRRMLEEGDPDRVAAFPGGRGTAHMVRIAEEAAVPVERMTPQVPKRTGLFALMGKLGR